MFNQKYQYVAATFLLMMLFSFQMLRTQLRVIIKDDKGNLKPNTEVTLFQSEEDYNNDKSTYGPVFSDKKGRAIFNKIGKGPYILEAKNGEYNNDFSNQLIEDIVEGKINKMEVVISR